MKNTFSAPSPRSFRSDIIALFCGGVFAKCPERYEFLSEHGRHHFIWLMGLEKTAYNWANYYDWNRKHQCPDEFDLKVIRAEAFKKYGRDTEIERYIYNYRRSRMYSPIDPITDENKIGMIKIPPNLKGF